MLKSLQKDLIENKQLQNSERNWIDKQNNVWQTVSFPLVTNSPCVFLEEIGPTQYCAFFSHFHFSTYLPPVNRSFSSTYKKNVPTEKSQVRHFTANYGSLDKFHKWMFGDMLTLSAHTMNKFCHFKWELISGKS